MSDSFPVGERRAPSPRAILWAVGFSVFVAADDLTGLWCLGHGREEGLARPFSFLGVAVTGRERIDPDVSVVAEANVAFALNMRMFEELDVLAGYEGAEVRPLSEALKFVDNSEKTNETGVAVKCPFASMQQGKVSSGEKSRGAVETLKVKHPKQ